MSLPMSIEEYAPELKGKPHETQLQHSLKIEHMSMQSSADNKLEDFLKQVISNKPSSEKSSSSSYRSSSDSMMLNLNMKLQRAINQQSRTFSSKAEQ